MNEDFEIRLRSRLRERAHVEGREIAALLNYVDRLPERRRSFAAAPKMLGAFAGLAAVVIFVGVLVFGLAGRHASVASSPARSFPELPAAWSPLAPDEALSAAARTLCLPDFGVDPGLPLALQDRRTPDAGRVVFASPTQLAACGVRRTADGIVKDGGGWGGPRMSPLESGVGSGGLRILNSTVSRTATDWNVIEGFVPDGTVNVKVVVGANVVAAVIGNGMYSVEWPGVASPTLLAAFDASGHELERIDTATLSKIFNPACPPVMTCEPAALTTR